MILYPFYSAVWMEAGGTYQVTGINRPPTPFSQCIEPFAAWCLPKGITVWRSLMPYPTSLPAALATWTEHFRTVFFGTLLISAGDRGSWSKSSCLVSGAHTVAVQCLIRLLHSPQVYLRWPEHTLLPGDFINIGGGGRSLDSIPMPRAYEALQAPVPDSAVPDSCTRWLLQQSSGKGPSTC